MRGTVFLDLYGTLVEADWPRLLKGRAALAARVGVPAAAAQRAWDATHIARMAGMYGSLAGDLRAVFREASNGRNPSPISSSTSAQLARDERENWRGGVKPYPDAVPALEHLRSRGLRLAIVTNASAEAAGVIDDLSLRSMVDDVFASCEAGVLKPQLLTVALGALGVDPSGATLVDDEPGQLDGAAQLGLGTILVRRALADASSGASSSGNRHRVVSDLRRLADLLLDGEGRRTRP